MMIAMFGANSTTGDFSTAAYGAASAYHQRAEAAFQPWPLKVVGTGGTFNVDVLKAPHGCSPFVWVEVKQVPTPSPYADLMQQVRRGFGRTMSRLPEVFGVSRQTLYNWLDGETPKLALQERLCQLAAAAKVFEDLAFKPNSTLLDQTLTQGQSFLQLMAQGQDGRPLAHKLIRVSARGQVARSKLDGLIGERKAQLGASDFGAPSLTEAV
jgi:transcriptional regulator with XRE-family HTH domain